MVDPRNAFKSPQNRREMLDLRPNPAKLLLQPIGRPPAESGGERAPASVPPGRGRIHRAPGLVGVGCGEKGGPWASLPRGDPLCIWREQPRPGSAAGDRVCSGGSWRVAGKTRTQGRRPRRARRGRCSLGARTPGFGVAGRAHRCQGRAHAARTRAHAAAGFKRSSGVSQTDPGVARRRRNQVLWFFAKRLVSILICSTASSREQ